MKPGDRCFALYRETPGDPLSTEFYLAVILKVNRNGSVHLRYSDGDEAFTVKTEEILMIDAARADLFDKVEQSQQDEEDGEQVTTKKQPSSSRKGRRGRAKDSRKSSKATTPEAIESKMEPVRPKKVESRAERLSRRRTSVDLTSENREDKVLENSTRRPGSIDVTAKSPALSERSSRRRGSVDVKAESHLERVTRSRGSDVKAMVAVHVEAATPMDVRSDYGRLNGIP
ncbi:hypothetical protein BC829DRAFT_104879 [Chytridium lagenaria]|nr:hypothetical protein BC829DRAFT_104879 [Chytridium lagenaria]